MLRAKKKLLAAALALVAAVDAAGSVRGVAVDARGRPVEGAWVYVLVPTGGQTALMDTGILPWNKVAPSKGPVFEVSGSHCYGPARSAADGTFVRKGTPPLWEGTAWVYHPDYLPGRLTGSQWESRGKEVDLGRVVLAGGESVEGTVRDEAGRPVAGALVGIQKVYRFRGLGRVKRKNYELCSPRPRKIGHIRSVRTDRDGEYRIAGLEPGVYLIAAWTDRLPPVEHEIELPGPWAGLRRDFGLSPGSPLTVTLTFSTGEACRGVPVKLKRRREGAWIWDLPVVASAHTDNEGHCLFRDLKPGEYYVTAVPPAKTRVGDRLFHSVGVTRTFKAGGEARLEIELVPVIPVRGIVVNAEDGEPVPDFEARLEGRHGAGDGNETRDGRFSFDDARPGEWRLEIHADGYFPKRERVGVPETGLDEPLSIELVPGEGKTHGLVLNDTTGEPLGGVEVLCYEWFKLCWGSGRKTFTGADGRYELDHLLGKSDSRWAKFTKAEYAEVKLDLDGTEPFPQELEIVRMVRTGSIRGVVFDADGRPAEGYGVRIVRGKFWPEAKTDARGRFEFKELAPGRYRLTGLADEVEVRPGETVEVEIRLSDTSRKEKARPAF